jgi:capsular polysaccharide transport system permease protein
MKESVKKKLGPMVRRSPMIVAAVVFSLLSALYWLAIASDRFVSEAHVIIQRTDLSSGQTVDLSSLLGGTSAGNKGDQLLLQDHLLSLDMLRQLDQQLNLRKHYSDPSHDMMSRLWFQDSPLERFHRYYLSRVSVEYDEYTGVLVIKAQAYDPPTAQAITAALVKEGERFMNTMAHELAQGQVTFLERQVDIMSNRVKATRQALLEYQNRKGMVSPQATAETYSSIVARLQAQRADLETQRASLQAYLVPTHPNVVRIDQQVAAIDRQLALEQAKLASPGGRSLNRTVEEFQRLEMEAGFAQDVYKTALTALETGRLEAIRTIKQMSVIQSPSRPQESLEPRRLYNVILFTLVALLAAGVLQLLLAIVRDHKD